MKVSETVALSSECYTGCDVATVCYSVKFNIKF